MATEWMTPEELSQLTGSDLKTLGNLRSARKRYPFYRVPGSRKPLYKREEIDQIIEEGRIEVRP